MSTLKSGWATLRYLRELISQGVDTSPKSGVWHSHITRAAYLANTILQMSLLALAVLVWSITGYDNLWILIAMMSCIIAQMNVSRAVGAAIDTNPELPPSNQVFAKWAALTALFGLPLGHLVMCVATLVHPMRDVPTLTKYLPEILLVMTVGMSYWRLVIIRLWFERLASEKLKRQAAEQGRALAETRLSLLEAQVEPHFLFNTLASVQHLVRKDAAQADVLLVQLISYLRQAIPDVRGTASTLGREMELVRTYLGIVRVRMGGRLNVEVHYPEALAEASFPALVVHTLVENAIRHGVEPQPGPVSIVVRARQTVQGDQDCIAVSVIDNGVGRGTAIEGMGLSNIRDRLVLVYQGRAQLEIADAPGGGVSATVCIPTD